MPKINKVFKIHVLAFFVLGGVVFPKPINAQDTSTLKNGLKVIIKGNPKSPIVVISAFVGTGSAGESDYLGSGISHLLEHMLFKSTKKFAPGAIESILHKYGGSINGWTSFDYTGYSITILKEHYSIGFDILEEMLLNPVFDPKELAKEKEVIEREIDLGEDDAARRASKLLFSAAYTEHPYRIPISGYKEKLKALEKEDLIKFFKNTYAPNNIVISIIGDIDKDLALGEAKKRFEGCLAGNLSHFSINPEPEQLTPRFIEEKAPFKGCYLNIAFRSTSLLDKDLYAMDLLSFIFGQGESSRLNRSIRLDKRLVLGISAYNFTPRYPGLFVISSVMEEENAKSTLQEIRKEIAVIKEKGIQDEELVKAKNNLLAGYIYGKESFETQANDLAIGQLLAGDPDFFKSYIEKIKTVTKEDIARAANKYLVEDTMTVSILSQSGNALKQEEVDLQKEHIGDVYKILLENNLPVLIREDNSLPILSIAAVLKGGLISETAQDNGISNLLSNMLIDGTSTMTREDITGLYESKGMSVNTYAGNNSIGIRIDLLKDQEDDALKLMSELLLDTAIPDNELDREKNEIYSLIDMQDDNIFNQGHRLLKKTLFKNHSYGFQAIGTKDSIKKIEKGQLLKLLRDTLSSENMVIGISGDCSKEKIEPIVRKYFLKVPQKEHILKRPGAEPPIEKARELEIRTKKDQSLVLMGFQGLAIYDKDRFAVLAMVDMLSRESGALFSALREKLGLAYATGAFQVEGIDPGYIAIYALTSSNNIQKVKEEMLKEIYSLRKRGVSDDDLEKSKNHLKAMREILFQKNSEFIFLVSLDELYGLGYGDHKTYNAKIGAITKEDIKRVIGRLLDPSKSTLVILRGEK